MSTSNQPQTVERQRPDHDNKQPRPHQLAERQSEAGADRTTTEPAVRRNLDDPGKRPVTDQAEQIGEDQRDDRARPLPWFKEDEENEECLGISARRLGNE